MWPAIERLRFCEEFCVVVHPPVASIQAFIGIQLDFVSELRLRHESSGKVDYETREAQGKDFINGTFGVQIWFSGTQLVYIH